MFQHRTLQERGVVHLGSLEFIAAQKEEEQYEPREGKVEEEEEEDNDEEEEEESFSRSLLSLPCISTPQRILKNLNRGIKERKRTSRRRSVLKLIALSTPKS